MSVIKSIERFDDLEGAYESEDLTDEDQAFYDHQENIGATMKARKSPEEGLSANTKASVSRAIAMKVFRNRK